jgi:ABC-2 type transport system permease protein
MLDTKVVTERETQPIHITALNAEEKIWGWRKFWVDFKYLWLEQLLEVRTMWYWFFIFSLFMPFSMVFGFARIGSGLTDRESLLYIISGAAIFAVATEGIMTMSQKFGEMKKMGMIVYYASLPISKTAFIMAAISVRMLVIMPGMLMPIIIGPMLYGMSFNFSLWILLLLPLTGLALSALGMVLGTLVNSLELIGVIGNILVFLLLFAAPIFIPNQALPLPLQILGYLIPPTYAAEALRQALSGTIEASFYLNVGVLALMSVISLTAVSKWLRWQLK